jgi:hypothetical protein
MEILMSARIVKVKIETEMYVAFKNKSYGAVATYRTSELSRETERLAKQLSNFIHSEWIDGESLSREIRNIEQLQEQIKKLSAQAVADLEQTRALFEGARRTAPEKLDSDKGNSWQYRYITFSPDSDEEIRALPKGAVMEFCKLLPHISEVQRENAERLAFATTGTEHYCIYRCWDGTLMKRFWMGVP